MLGKRARYRKVLKQSGISSHNAISIGDEVRDIEAANHEHIPFGAVAWGFNHIDSLVAHAPAEVFMEVDDIRKQIG